MDKESAESLARQWAQGEVAPEDFDETIKEWKLDETVRELVKTGDLHQKQIAEEILRRKDAGRFDNDQEAFVDKFPRKEGV